MVDARLLDRQGRCRPCGSTAYTVRELNLHADQAWECYRCRDDRRRRAA